MANKLSGYELSRGFWDFAFENTGKIKPIHAAIYFFAIEHCNRLGWKENFGLPTTMVLEAISVKSYSVYKSAFDDLVEFEFFEIVQYSKNQYSSNIIALKEYCKANDKAHLKAHLKADYKADYKALDKAMLKHIPKHLTSQRQSMVSIDKQLNNITIEQGNGASTKNILKDEVEKENYPIELKNKFLNYWTEKNKKGKERWEMEKTWETSKRISNWASREKKPFEKSETKHVQPHGTKMGEL